MIATSNTISCSELLDFSAALHTSPSHCTALLEIILKIDFRRSINFLLFGGNPKIPIIRFYNNALPKLRLIYNGKIHRCKKQWCFSVSLTRSSWGRIQLFIRLHCTTLCLMRTVFVFHKLLKIFMQMKAKFLWIRPNFISAWYSVNCSTLQSQQ